MAIPLLVSTLLSAGPSLIRAAGNLLGGDKAETANKVAGVVESLTGKSPAQQEAGLQAQLGGLSPAEREHLLGLQVELKKIEVEREARQLQNQETHHQITADVIQNGDNASSDYVRETRPKMARGSCYATIAYTLGMSLAQVFDYGPGPQEWIILALSGGMITYMTGRTVDAFSKFKGPKL